MEVEKTSIQEEPDKGIVYNNGVLLGNWYETRSLQDYKVEQMFENNKSGNLLLGRYRAMTKNLNAPVEVSKSTSYTTFGSKVCFIAPHVPNTQPPAPGKTGVMLGGRINGNMIHYTEDLVDSCEMAGLARVEPVARSVFIISSSDYCDRDGEPLKYAQEFMLKLASSVDKTPVYVRHDRIPVPGLAPKHSVYLSKNPVANCRWRILPVQQANITRFEQEGENVPVGKFMDDKGLATSVANSAAVNRMVEVNTDIIINHCSTNINLGTTDEWSLGFHGKINTLCIQTCLDVYGNEKKNNIWRIYIPVKA